MDDSKWARCDPVSSGSETGPGLQQKYGRTLNKDGATKLEAWNLGWLRSGVPRTPRSRVRKLILPESKDDVFWFVVYDREYSRGCFGFWGYCDSTKATDRRFVHEHRLQ